MLLVIGIVFNDIHLMCSGILFLLVSFLWDLKAFFCDRVVRFAGIYL